ncbi:hypothetical protein GN244_ATG12907 [Phytophthora infestans]|uniref:Uncharacterized protein n=1 Tax=Phytophthora infestans TaxID=4787 RepID=A0A833VZ89_PHYIN|nr:hypothetical protein GN244_ATG12907 [Phytophthora infestans]KAF4134683.1 hypothetical protein GN958_ATG15939 [Phytophthora infestans]
MITKNLSRLQVGMPFTAQLSSTPSDLAVLEAFLDEMTALDSQFVLLTDRKTTSRSKSSKQPYKSPNPAWKCRKEELQFLRAETKKLETQVAFLKLRETHAKLFNKCMGTTKGHELGKATAKRERQQYPLAQAENARLKMSIKRYQKISDTLQAAMEITDTTDLENLQRTAISLQGKMRVVRQLQLLNTAVFSTLECRVQARLGELDTVLRILRNEGDTDQVQVYQHGNLHPGSVVEFTRDRLMPFSAEQTSTVVWDIMQLDDFLSQRSTFKPSKDDIGSEGWYSMTLKCGGTATLRSHCLKKRLTFQEDSQF